MATPHIHVAALFQPYTLRFYDGDEQPSSPEAPPPPHNTSVPELPSRLDVQRSSTIDLPTRPSTTSLFHGPTPPLTPTAAAQEFFSPLATSESLKSSRRHSRQLGDPRSLARSELDELARDPVYNQPRSRAGPLPSGSILDFAKVHEQLKQDKLKEAKKKTYSPPQSRGSRNHSHERGFEDKPWTVEPALMGNEGLINALRSLASEESLELSWIGTLGFPTEALPASARENIDDHMLNEYQSSVVYVSDKDFDGHYTHYSKTILWPIFHYQVPDHPKSKAYEDHSWGFYENVNQAFADKIVESYKRGDTIWVHDYHLLLVPGMVRKKLPDASIGFFLHTAFPSSEIFRCLATRKELLEGMLGANLVAFQTDEYAQHFLQTCSRILTVETTSEGVQLEDHFVNVTSAPIGINPAAIDESREDPDVQKWIDDIGERYKDKLLIVARDKLDNVHGVRQKLLAYELFLNKYPDLARKTVLIQVATSTSEQSELITTVSDICSRIDNKYSSLVHQPLVFLKQDIETSQYLALMSVADVLMITALRDGMNLTCHEYIYCQDGKAGSKKHGPLILSEFTGSAAVFKDHLIINPWDYQKMADAIKIALLMSDAEKEHRWRAMHSVIMEQTGARWARQLDKALAKVHEEHNQRSSTSVPRLSTVAVSEKYKRAGNRVFIIDYEGTLAPHKTREGIPLTSPTRVVDTLNDLMNDPKNTVYIMSGRKPEELESVFRTANGLGLIAENGCFVRSYGVPANGWEVMVDMDDVERWKDDVQAVLNYYHERMEGSYIEERHCSTLFRYEKVEDQEAAIRTGGDCADQINSGFQNMSIHAVPINKAVLIEQVEFSKGTAATNAYNTLKDKSSRGGSSPVDFLMVAGDDREDEVVFRWANQLGKDKEVRDVFTVSVGRRNTEAQAAVTQGSTGLLGVLQKLGKISFDSAPVDYFNSPRKARVSGQ
ncbi:Trehalose-6-P synthase/phosphatase complex subunit [Saxophila tyrrhenica]|uniref:Trehalose-6-P synthase/phosphatase complex subunit n=1 Tax=Saxophila tyrrhenica TaxID=1690608 RepID=A0AAV9PMV2_9PEZI|nr:Trehalose-6-P synthase/phosphatase complex subunit [Saxophila tyrrhenica]